MDNELSKIIGKRINTLLSSNNVKQKDLAEYLGVPDNTISYFCNGKRMPNTEQIKKIAQWECFNTSVDYLLGLTETASADKDIKFICDYTGLEENTVDTLNFYKNIFSTIADNEIIRNQKPMIISFRYLNKFIENFDFYNFFLDFYERGGIVNKYKKDNEGENQNPKHLRNLKNKFERDIAINTFVVTEKYKKLYEEFCSENIKGGE